jgi:hypothetical protein
MTISREYLEAQIRDMQAKEANFLALANSAHGAADMAKHLLNFLENAECVGPAMSTADLEAAIGGKVESISPINGDSA